MFEHAVQRVFEVALVDAQRGEVDDVFARLHVVADVFVAVDLLHLALWLRRQRRHVQVYRLATVQR